MTRYHDAVAGLVEAVQSSPGETTPELRRAVAARAGVFGASTDRSSGVPDDLRGWVDTVARHAYRTTEEGVAALRASGYTEAQIFELTVAAALGAAHARLDRALAVLGEKGGSR